MKKRDCQECIELLGPYLDRELDETRRSRVEEHLASCPDCRKELAAFQTLHKLVKERDHGPALADDFWDWHRSQVWRRIRAGRKEGRQPMAGPRFFWFRLGIVASGVAIALVVVIAGWQLLGTAGKKHEPITIAGDLSEKARTGQELGGATAGEKGAEVAAATRAAAPAPMAETEAGQGLAMQPAGKAASLELKAAAGKGGFAEERPGTAEAAPAERSALDEEFAASSTRVFAATARLADSLQGVVAGLCEKLPKLIAISDLPTVSPDETATVMLKALVEADGSVSQVRVTRSSGIRLLDTIAVANVWQARFQPGMEADSNVRCWVTVPQTFRAVELPAEDADSSRKSDK